jgi:hypothetical protein
MSLHNAIIRTRHYISTQCNNKVFHIHLQEEAHDKQIPKELQHNPHKINSNLSVLFYLINLCNFITEFKILYFIS